MKKLLAAVFAAAVCYGSSAFAADMPVPAPVYKAAPAPYDPWSGFYAGGSIGARFSDVDWTNTSFAAGLTSVANPTALDATSARVGGYVGYNWRLASNWLVGLEADIAWGSNKKTSTPWPGTPFAGSGGHDFVSAALDWDGSLRGRLGYLVSPNWLLYTTGGVAWQQIKTTATCDGSGPSACGVPGGISESSSTTKAGWTIGAGIETAFAGHWLARIEYRYADFGHVANNLPLSAGVGQSFTGDIKVRTNTALLGLAYKF